MERRTYMEIMTNSKDVIKRLKEVKAEKNLSLDAIVSLLEQNGHFVSKSTLSRVFSDKSDDCSFRYEETILPLAHVLLDVGHNEQDDDIDTLAFKSILRYKKDLIDDYRIQNEKLKSEIEELKSEIEIIKDKEKVKYAEKLEKETKHFNDSVEFMRNQILLKDQRIDKLMDSNERLSKTNDKLINQLMDCPLRKCE